MRKVLFILGQLDDDDVEWIIETGYREHIPAHQVLIQEGKLIQALYIVLNGLLSVTDAELDGKELARLGAGEIVGEMSFIDASPPASTVTALQPSTVFVIPKAELSAKLEQDMRFAAHFYRAIAIFLSGRLRATVGRLGYGDAPSQSLSQETRYADELDDNVIDNVHLAGARFERILKRLAID
jgi:bacteriocin-type transport-associated protein